MTIAAIPDIKERRCPVHKRLLFKMADGGIGQGHCKDCRRSYIFDTRNVRKDHSPHVT